MGAACWGSGSRAPKKQLRRCGQPWYTGITPEENVGGQPTAEENVGGHRGTGRHGPKNCAKIFYRLRKLREKITRKLLARARRARENGVFENDTPQNGACAKMARPKMVHAPKWYAPKWYMPQNGAAHFGTHRAFCPTRRGAGETPPQSRACPTSVPVRQKYHNRTWSMRYGCGKPATPRFRTSVSEAPRFRYASFPNTE